MTKFSCILDLGHFHQSQQRSSVTIVLEGPCCNKLSLMHYLSLRCQFKASGYSITMFISHFLHLLLLIPLPLLLQSCFMWHHHLMCPQLDVLTTCLYQSLFDYEEHLTVLGSASIFTGYCSIVTQIIYVILLYSWSPGCISVMLNLIISILYTGIYLHFLITSHFIKQYHSRFINLIEKHFSSLLFLTLWYISAVFVSNPPHSYHLPLMPH